MSTTRLNRRSFLHQGAAFTPDGRRVLVLGSDGVCRAHAVGTWERVFERGDPASGFTRGHRVAFHPGGRAVAFARDRVALRLVDAETWAERTVLPYPDSHNLAADAFSPDGRYLAAVTVRGAVQVWDLAVLRGRLRDLGLDWPDDPRGYPEARRIDRRSAALPRVGGGGRRRWVRRLKLARSSRVGYALRSSQTGGHPSGGGGRPKDAPHPAGPFSAQ